MTKDFSLFFFIGPESDHWVNLIDVTLACEDAYSKLVEVVTVADDDDEDRVGKSLLQIWKLRFGHNAKLLFTSTRFGQDFEVEQKLSFMTKPQLPNLQQSVANTILINNTSSSNNLNKF